MRCCRSFKASSSVRKLNIFCITRKEDLEAITKRSLNQLQPQNIPSFLSLLFKRKRLLCAKEECQLSFTRIANRTTKSLVKSGFGRVHLSGLQVSYNNFSLVPCGSSNLRDKVTLFCLCITIHKVRTIFTTNNMIQAMKVLKFLIHSSYIWHKEMRGYFQVKIER